MKKLTVILIIAIFSLIITASTFADIVRIWKFSELVEIYEDRGMYPDLQKRFDGLMEQSLQRESRVKTYDEASLIAGFQLSAFKYCSPEIQSKVGEIQLILLRGAWNEFHDILVFNGNNQRAKKLLGQIEKIASQDAEILAQDLKKFIRIKDNGFD